jgi:glycosyltransferase involved in cell wall biosynthesis
MPHRVSLCLIAKNEAHRLPACLGSVADLVHESIVVDTGSTDATRQIAASRGAKVFDFPWRDSFSAAMNEAIRHARGEWIFWLHADHWVDEGNRQHRPRSFSERPGAALPRRRASIDGALLRSRLLMIRKDFPAAKKLLAETIARAPKATWPRELLAHALLMEGRDTPALVQALRDVLVLDPTNSFALANLPLAQQKLQAPE